MKLFLFSSMTFLFLLANIEMHQPRSYQGDSSSIPIDTVEFACLSHGGPLCNQENTYYFQAYSANGYLPTLIQKQFNIHDGDSICIKKNGFPIFQGALPDSMIMFKTNLNKISIDSLGIHIQEPRPIYYQKN